MRPFLLVLLALHLILQETDTQNTDTAVATACKIEIYLVTGPIHDSTIVRPSHYHCRYCFDPMIESLDNEPLVNDSDITGYEIAGDHHYIQLTSACMKRLQLRENELSVRHPFAMLVNGKPIYGAWFLSRFVSNYHGTDAIFTFMPLNEDGSCRMRIDISPNRIDLRSNTELLDCLTRTGRLKK